VIISKGHVASMGEMNNAYTILVENLKGRDHLNEMRED
jgi:hypothetical protein